MATENGRIQFLCMHELSAVLKCETGLHIGAGRESVEIGGLDAPVIKHPHTQQPYIPGSSLKGKLRSLLEWTFGVAGSLPYGSDPDGEYPGNDVILRLFGTTSKKWRSGPTRLIARDSFLDPAWVTSVLGRGLNLTEEKTEVVIDRLQGKAAENIGPRTMERVPAGALFRVQLLVREYDTGEGGRTDRRAVEWLVAAMKLLEQDALGGSGSRGYGRVRFEQLSLDGKPIQDAFDQIGPIATTEAPPVRLFEN
jgi:CRISPR-associated protein Csm3